MDDPLVGNIQRQYELVMNRVLDAGQRSGNKNTRLVVVSKSQPMDLVKAAIQAGIARLGENYAEEGVEKILALGGTGVEWHMIGHVQGRKAGLVAQHFDMLHSLDSLKLAIRINRECIDLHRVMPVLVEINISGENSKAGFPGWDEKEWSDLLAKLGSLTGLSGLRVSGLMTMPPYSPDALQSRPYFKKLHNLQDFLMKHLPGLNWQELSMGTSSDYLVAVEEGATYIRVGQAILGPRPVRVEKA
jgi:PLP dependent protein